MWGARVFVGAAATVALGATSAAAQATAFSYVGREQTYTVPLGISSVLITAIGARGGGPLSCCLAAGRGAVVSGIVNVTPGRALYVEVGGSGGLPAGGFNGGGYSPTRHGLSVYGGGGASDVRTLPMSAGVTSLSSRLIVAAGGGGSGNPAASGGDAGEPGGSAPNTFVGGGAGTQTAGGAGGCDVLEVGCGMDGSLGHGGAGGSSGDGALTREGAGGGGGLYGGGGGGGVLDGAVGGGGGGSSLVPSDSGTMSLASLTTPPSVVITPLRPSRCPPLPASACGTEFLGRTAFVSPSGVVGVFLGCLADRSCQGTMTIKNGTEVIAHRNAYTIPPDYGGIVHLTVSRSTRRSLAYGHVAVTVSITDVHGAIASASVMLVQFGTAADAASEPAATPSRIAIFGHTGFVSPSGVAGVFLGCFGTRDCAGTITLTAGHTAIATRHGTLVQADNGGIVHIPLNAAGRSLLTHPTLKVNVAVRDTDGPIAAGTVTLEHFN